MITIKINNEPPVITTSVLQESDVGGNYHQTINTSGTRPIKWSVESGCLPDGLTFHNILGVIIGRPKATGAFNFTLKAENAAGSDTKAFSIVINPAAPPSIITSVLPEGNAGGDYHATISFSGSQPIYLSTENGYMPSGLVFYNGIGIITGVPNTTGTYNFTVKAENVAGSDTRAFSIVINPAVPPAVITPPSLPEGNLDSGYNQKLSASGTAPAIWTICSGSLPPGLQLYSNGVVFGAPKVDGTYTFEAKAENAGGYDTKDFSISISPDMSGVPLTGGYIEIGGRPYHNNEEVYYDDIPLDIWVDWTQLKFVPEPPNAMLTSIEWHGGNIIFEGDGVIVQAKQETSSAIDHCGGEIGVNVNGNFTTNVTIQAGPDG